MTSPPTSNFDHAFGALPLIAILRGIKPDEAVDVAEAIVAAGVRIVEIPLNSPEALVSIGRIANALSGVVIAGAGTVLSREQVIASAGEGATVVVSPNTNPVVIEQARELGLTSIPGIMTPTEAFTALAAGASALKLFPAELVTPASIRALSAVLPPNLPLILVGSVTPETIAYYHGTRVAGFGIGSSLYTPNMKADAVGTRAKLFVRATHAFQKSLSKF